LIGGGQMKITEHWVPVPDQPGRVWRGRTILAIAAHNTDAQLRYCHGEIKSVWTDMQSAAIVLHGRAECAQAVADRAAATLRALTADENSEVTQPDRDRFYALLDGSVGCCVCGRALGDEVSKLLGIGPNCARRWNVPHSRAAAATRLRLRREILGENDTR
jgi:hypothetical protein